MINGKIYLNEKEGILCVKTIGLNWHTIVMLEFWFLFGFALAFGLFNLANLWITEYAPIVSIFVGLVMSAALFGNALKKGKFHRIKQRNYLIGAC